ncbi:MAG: FMN-binding glutamate synthase family protein [Thermodesulfobacteriota bacterium]
MRRQFLIGVLVVILSVAVISLFYRPFLWSLLIFAPLILIGFNDFFQKKHSVRRNFPLLGNMRYVLELIRPEVNQYFIESNSDGVPFSREQRSLVYQRAKKNLDTLPFGTQMNVYEIGYEWVNHSLHPIHLDPCDLRVTIGGPDCKKPYNASIFNVSAMSFGALSSNAVMALNEGAKIGDFAHNTGEGGLSSYHKRGGDLIWQIGTAYFGCRTENGDFCPDKFKESATLEQVKMIELKLSQGAKPGHGGILPKSKIMKEISEIRGVPMGKDIISPPAHKEFSTPVGLLEFIQKLRELSGGKPVGFKLCVGKRREFLAVCKAMHKTGITPDFISVDGGEGGTGAAPLEFSNHIGTPLVSGLIFVHNALVGFSLRDRIKIISSGKITSGFGIIKQIALGADICSSARAMMMAIGCIQALRCNTNKCPVGVTTQDPNLVAGLVVSDKKIRVANYHGETIKSVAEMIGAMGLPHTNDLKEWHIMRRTGVNEVHHYGEIYNYLKDGELLGEPLPLDYERACNAAVAESFLHAEDIDQVQ